MRPAPAHAGLDAARVEPDTPLRLAVAAAIAYPDGSMTAEALKREASAGRLVVAWDDQRKGYVTTLAAIKSMRNLCRKIGSPAIPCVYVVGFGPYVKIGFTAAHFDRRLRALHGGFPEKLATYATFPNATRVFERDLQKRFSAHRLQYEWFRREGDLADWIAAGCPR